MMRAIILASALATLACTTYTTSAYPGPTATYVAPTRAVPAGTPLSVVLDATPAAGDTVRGHLIADVRSSDDSEVLIPAGAVLMGRVLAATNGEPQVVRFESIEMGGATQPIDADVVGFENGAMSLVPGMQVEARLAQPISSMASLQQNRYY